MMVGFAPIRIACKNEKTAFTTANKSLNFDELYRYKARNGFIKTVPVVR